MNRKILSIILSFVLLLLFATPAFAQEPDGAQVVFGDNFVLESEKTLDNDLVVFGGNVTIEKGSRIEGDVIVFGGNVHIDGVVDGDIGLIGGNIDLGETAVVEGDVGLAGGSPNIAEGAVIKGDIQSLTNFEYNYEHESDDSDDDDDDNVDGIRPPRPVAPVAPVPPFPHSRYDDYEGGGIFSWVGNVIGDVVGTVVSLVILGIITWLVAAFLPEHMGNVRETIFKSAPVSFGLGLVTLLVAIVVVPLAFLLLITVCLALVPIAAYVLLGAAVLFGWIVMGQILGERLLAASGRPDSGFIFSSIVGVSVLTLVSKMPVISLLPCIGFLFGLIGGIIGILAALTGLGAVLLTRFGTRPYPVPISYFSGPSRPGSSPISTGPRVRWTDPEPRVSAEAPVGSEVELNARIKAALAEADRMAEENPEPSGEAPEMPGDEEQPSPEKPKRSRKPRNKAEDDPESGETL